MRTAFDVLAKRIHARPVIIGCLLFAVAFTGPPPLPVASGVPPDVVAGILPPSTNVVKHSPAYLAWQAANPGVTNAPWTPNTNYNLSWGYYKYCSPPNKMRVIVFRSTDLHNWTIATNLPFGCTNALFPGTNSQAFFLVGLFTQ